MRLLPCLKFGLLLAPLLSMNWGCKGEMMTDNQDMASPPPDLLPLPPDMTDVGLAWREEPTNSEYGLYDIRGSDASHVWAVGDGHTVLFSKGDGVWTPQTAGLPTGDIGVFNDVFPIGGEIFLSYNHIVADANYGVGKVYRQSGDGQWTQDYDFKAGVIGLWGSSPTNLFAVGAGTNMGDEPLERIFRRTGAGTWSVSRGGNTNYGTIYSVWGTSDKAIYAVGEDENYAALVYFWNGTTWQRQTTPDTAFSLYAVGGSGPDDVYAVGDGVILHSTGDGKWEEVDPGVSDRFAGIWAAGKGDIWVVGISGALRYKGGTWDFADMGEVGIGADMLAIWGTGPDNIYISTGSDVILHYYDKKQ